MEPHPPKEPAWMTSFGRRVGRKLGKSLKTSLPRESLLSLPFSSSAGCTFSPLPPLGLYSPGTCRGVFSMNCQAVWGPVPKSGECRHLRCLKRYTTRLCGLSSFCFALDASSTVLRCLPVLLSPTSHACQVIISRHVYPSLRNLKLLNVDSGPAQYTLEAQSRTFASASDNHPVSARWTLQRDNLQDAVL